jgi:general secretion pathway protein F
VPKFHYQAVSAVGEVLAGEMEARDDRAVIERLQQVGHLPVRVEPAGGAAPRGVWLADLFGRNTLRPKTLALFARELATLLEAGLPLERSLAILVGLTDDAATRTLVAGVLDRVRGGATLADAMAAEPGAFPRLFLGMVRAGEAGGSLELVMARLATLLDKSMTLRDNVKSALIYPAILLLMVGATIVVLVTVVLPQFRPLFEEAGDAMPLSALIFLAVGDVLTGYGWLLALLLGVAVLGARQLLRQPERRLQWDTWLLRLPLFGDLICKYETAIFCRTLSALVANGMALPNALAVARETVANGAMSAAIGVVGQSLKEGGGFAAPLAQAKVFPALAVELAHVGEETGKLDDMLSRAADIYDGEVRRALERMLAMLVPALTIFLGLIVAGVIGSVLSALLSINELAI